MLLGDAKDIAQDLEVPLVSLVAIGIRATGNRKELGLVRFFGATIRKKTTGGYILTFQLNPGWFNEDPYNGLL